MKKLFFFLILPLIVIVVVILLFVTRKDEVEKIDVTETDFEYEADICDEYFELVDCIINKDTDERFTKQMRIDLKNEVKLMQEKWKSFNQDELTKKCEEELNKYDNEIMQNKLKAFWCLK